MPKQNKVQNELSLAQENAALRNEILISKEQLVLSRASAKEKSYL